MKNKSSIGVAEQTPTTQQNTFVFPPIPKGWHSVLSPIMTHDSMIQLGHFLHSELKRSEEQENEDIFPPQELWFNALHLTPLCDVKVVILGQDPYFNPQQAHGLAFSVRQGVKIPPSLRNIFKEINRDMPHIVPLSCDLTPWAKQGVLLLNATLTVRQGSAGSHQKQGWEDFTDYIIRHISKHCDHVVFMLWGSFAQSKIPFIDQTKHTLLTSSHPSPLSAHRGFLGCGHFSACNTALESHNQTPIMWKT